MFANMEETMLLVAMKSIRALSSEVGGHLPIDVGKAAALLGYRIEHSPIQAAGYIPEGENVIVVRSTDVAARRRFTVAHEIGHVLWRRVCKCDSDRSRVFRNRRHNREERIADQLATELLMPMDDFGTEFARHRVPSFGAVYSLASLFGVSYECCVRRITELRNVIACAYWYQLDESDPSLRKVRYRKGYSTRPGLQFIDPPVEAASKCVEYVARHGGRWRSFLHLHNGGFEFQVPIEAEVTKEKGYMSVRILGWRFPNAPMVSPMEANQLVI